MDFYPRLFEGVADKYAEREFYIPDETKGQFIPDEIKSQVVKKQEIKNKVIHSERYYAIIKNPTSLNNFADSVRAVFTKAGDLYVVSNRNLVHSSMIELLEKIEGLHNDEKWWWRNPKNFITLERIGLTNKFAIGESNDAMDPELDEHTREHYQMPYFEECEAYFQEFVDEAQKLFPQYKFINTHKKYVDEKEWA